MLDFIHSLKSGNTYIGNTKIDSLESIEVTDNTQSMELPIIGTDIRPLLTKEGVNISYSLTFNIFADTPEQYTEKVQKLIIQLNTFPVISIYSIKLFYLLYNPLMGLKDVTEQNIKDQYKDIIELTNKKIKEYNRSKENSSKDNYKTQEIPTQGAAIPIIIHQYNVSLDNTKLGTYTFSILFSIFNYKPFMEQLLYAKTPQTCLYKYVTSVVDTSEISSYRDIENYMKSNAGGSLKIEYTPFTVESEVYTQQIDYRLKTKHKKDISIKYKPTIRTYKELEKTDNFKSFMFNLTYHLYSLNDIQGFVNLQIRSLTNIIKNIDSEAVKKGIRESKPNIFQSLNTQITTSLIELQSAIDTLKFNIQGIKEYLKKQSGQKRDSYSFDTSAKNHLFSIFALSELIPMTKRTKSNIALNLVYKAVKLEHKGVLTNIFDSDYLKITMQNMLQPFPAIATANKDDKFTTDWYKTAAIISSYSYAVNSFYEYILTETGKKIDFDDYSLLEKFKAITGKTSMIVGYDLSKLTYSFQNYLNSLMSKDGKPLPIYKDFISNKKVPLFLFFYGILKYLWTKADTLAEDKDKLKNIIKTAKSNFKNEPSLKSIKQDFINKIFIDLIQTYIDSYEMFEKAVIAMFGENTINYKIDLYNNQIVPQNIVIQKEFSRPSISLTKYLQPTTQFMGKSNYKIQMSFICQDIEGLVKLRHFAELIDVQKKLLKQRVSTAKMIDYGFLNNRMINNDFLLNEDKIQVTNCPLFKSLGIEYIKINNLSIKTIPDKPDNYVVNLDIIEDNKITPILEKLYAINTLTPELKMRIFKETFPADPIKLLKVLNATPPGDMLNYVKRLYPLMDTVEDCYLSSKYSKKSVKYNEVMHLENENLPAGSTDTILAQDLFTKAQKAKSNLNKLSSAMNSKISKLDFNEILNKFSLKDICIPNQPIEGKDLLNLGSILFPTYFKDYANQNLIEYLSENWDFFSIVTGYFNLFKLNFRTKKDIKKNTLENKLSSDTLKRLKEWYKKYDQFYSVLSFQLNKEGDRTKTTNTLMLNLTIKMLLYVNDIDFSTLFFKYIKKIVKEHYKYYKKEGFSSWIEGLKSYIKLISDFLELFSQQDNPKNQEYLNNLLILLSTTISIYTLNKLVATKNPKLFYMEELKAYENAEFLNLLQTGSLAAGVQSTSLFLAGILITYLDTSYKIFLKAKDKKDMFEKYIFNEEVINDYDNRLLSFPMIRMGNLGEILLLKTAQSDSLHYLSSFIYMYDFRETGYNSVTATTYMKKLEKFFKDSPYQLLSEQLGKLCNTSGLVDVDVDAVIERVLNTNVYGHEITKLISYNLKEFAKKSKKEKLSQEERQAYLKELIATFIGRGSIENPLPRDYQYITDSDGKKTIIELPELIDSEAIAAVRGNTDKGFLGISENNQTDPKSSGKLAAALLAKFMQVGNNVADNYKEIQKKYKATLKYARIFEPFGGTYLKPTYSVYFAETDNASVYNYDDFYRYFSIAEINWHKAKDMASNTATIVCSNVFMNLNDPLSEIYVKESSNPFEIDTINENVLSTLNLKIGTKVIIKMGYYPDLRLAPVCFSGRISSIEFQNGSVKIQAQSAGTDLLQIVKNGVLFKTDNKFCSYRSYGTLATALLDSVPITRDLGTRKILDYIGGVINTTLPIIKSITSPKAPNLFSKAWGTIGPITKTATEILSRERSKSENENIKANLADRLFSRVLNNYGYNPRDDNIQLEYSFDDPDIFKTKESGKGIHFKWKVYNKTVWESLREVSLYTGSDTIVTTRLFYEGMPWEIGKIRETLYIGPRDGYYKATDSDLSYFGMIDNNTYLYKGKRLIAAPIDKNTGYPIVNSNLPKKYSYWESYNKNLSIFPKVTYLTPNFPNTELKADGTIRGSLRNNVTSSLFNKLLRRDRLDEISTQTSNIKVGMNIEELIGTIRDQPLEISKLLKKYFQNIIPEIKKYDKKLLENPIRKLNNDIIKSTEEDEELAALQLLSGYLFLREGISGDYYTIKIKYENGKSLVSRPIKLLDLPIFFILFDKKILGKTIDDTKISEYIKKLRQKIKENYYDNKNLKTTDKKNISYSLLGLNTEDLELCNIISEFGESAFEIIGLGVLDPISFTKAFININFQKKLKNFINKYYIKSIPTEVMSLDYYPIKQLLNENNLRRITKYQSKYNKMLIKYPNLKNILETAYKELTMIFANFDSDSIPPHPQYLPINRMHFINSDMIITNNIHPSSENVTNKIILTYSGNPAIYELDAKKFKKQTMVQADQNIDPDFIKPKIVYANNIDYNKFSMLKYGKKLEKIEESGNLLDEYLKEINEIKTKIKRLEKLIKKEESNKTLPAQINTLNERKKLLEQKLKDKSESNARIKRLYKSNQKQIEDYFNILKKENAAEEKEEGESNYIENFNKVIKDISANNIFAIMPRTNLIANRLLSDGLKEMYQGKLVILGKSDIEPFDIIILDDKISFMSGVFEVKDVTTIMNREVGYITTITPHALTSFRNSSFVDELKDIHNYYKTVDNWILYPSAIGVGVITTAITASKLGWWSLAAGAVTGLGTFAIVSPNLKILRLGQALGLNPIEVCPLFQYGVPLTAGLEGATFTTFKASQYTKDQVDVRSKFGL